MAKVPVLPATPSKIPQFSLLFADGQNWDGGPARADSLQSSKSSRNMSCVILGDFIS